jgi:hypothetical protein
LSAPNLVRLSLIVFLEDEKSLSAIVFGVGIHNDKTVPVSVPAFFGTAVLCKELSIVASISIATL